VSALRDSLWWQYPGGCDRESTETPRLLAGLDELKGLLKTEMHIEVRRCGIEVNARVLVAEGHGGTR
jgi:hypothetical protein